MKDLELEPDILINWANNEYVPNPNNMRRGTLILLFHLFIKEEQEEEQTPPTIGNLVWSLSPTKLVIFEDGS